MVDPVEDLGLEIGGDVRTIEDAFRYVNPYRAMPWLKVRKSAPGNGRRGAGGCFLGTGGRGRERAAAVVVQNGRFACDARRLCGVCRGMLALLTWSIF